MLTQLTQQLLQPQNHLQNEALILHIKGIPMLYFDKFYRQSGLCYTEGSLSFYHLKYSHSNQSSRLYMDYCCLILKKTGRKKNTPFTAMHIISTNKDRVFFQSLIYRCYKAIVLTACQSPRKLVAYVFWKHPQKKRSVIKSILSITSAMSRSKVQGLLLNS